LTDGLDKLWIEQKEAQDIRGAQRALPIGSWSARTGRFDAASSDQAGLDARSLVPSDQQAPLRAGHKERHAKHGGQLRMREEACAAADPANVGAFDNDAGLLAYLPT